MHSNSVVEQRLWPMRTCTDLNTFVNTDLNLMTIRTGSTPGRRQDSINERALHKTVTRFINSGQFRHTLNWKRTLCVNENHNSMVCVCVWRHFLNTRTRRMYGNGTHACIIGVHIDAECVLISRKVVAATCERLRYVL